MTRRKLTEADVATCTITRRFTHYDRQQWHADARPFSEISIVLTDGTPYLSRVFYPLDDTPHARAAQIQDFLKRQNAPWPGE